MPKSSALRGGRPAIAGNTATGVLKIIALVFMFIDHAGKMVWPQYGEMRVLGRIAFPLYCWCMAVGVTYTRSVPKYLLRLLLIGLASQPLYMVALNHPWYEPNIFFTLLVGLCGVWGMKEKKALSHLWAPILALLAAQLLDVDYGWRGVLLMLLLYGVRGSRAGIAGVMVAFCLFWGNSSYSVTSFFGLNLNPLLRQEVIGPVLSPWLKVQALAVLALPLMVVQFPFAFKLPRWLSYAIYPLHLALLIVLEASFLLPIHWERLTDVWHALLALVS